MEFLEELCENNYIQRILRKHICRFLLTVLCNILRLIRSRVVIRILKRIVFMNLTLRRIVKNRRMVLRISELYYENL